MTIGIVQLLDELGGWVADYTIIQDAIDAASDGYTIVIGEGTYTEQIIVDGIDDLTITTDGGPVTVKAPADRGPDDFVLVRPGSPRRGDGPELRQCHDRL